MSRPAATYTLCHTTTVDRPERRDSSFAPVAPGTKVFDRFEGLSFASAKRNVAALLAGEHDYSSEFISSIQVTRHSARGVSGAPGMPLTRRGRASTDGRECVVTERWIRGERVPA